MIGHFGIFYRWSRSCVGHFSLLENIEVILEKEIFKCSLFTLIVRSLCLADKTCVSQIRAHFSMFSCKVGLLVLLLSDSDNIFLPASLKNSKDPNISSLCDQFPVKFHSLSITLIIF